MKKCSTCKKEKNYSEFHKDRIQKDGLRTNCKACRNQYYQKNRGVLLDYQKQYEQNNPEIIRKNDRKTQRKRRAMKRAIQENYTKQDEAYTRQLFANICFNCNATDNLEVDHHYPLSKGFPLTRDNAVLLCKSCNSSKSNKMPEEFYTESELVQLDFMLNF